MRNGKQQLYIERESELEEVLLRDKLEKMEVADKSGTPFEMTHSRWQRFTRRLKEYEGWASALRAEYGNDVINFLEASQILDEGVTDADRAVEVVRAETPAEEPLELELVSEDRDELQIRVVERRTGSAATHRVRRELFYTTEYHNLVRVHAELEKLAGMPPFDVRLGKREARALSFEELRRVVVETAKEDVTELKRFKGLGEMNPDELYDTTMDPERRTLQRVTIEDASAADQIFSMLMGEKVEPRREFIESHARDVTNLDV
jgi:DNA gyrase subunit B